MIESHYPSLELCKKLKEIGFPDTELFLHKNHSPRWQYRSDRENLGNHWEDNQIYPCPSVMEMLDVMPDHVMLPQDTDKGWKYAYQILINKRVSNIGYDVFYHRAVESSAFLHSIELQPLPNALAEMLLWLHENKHLTFQNGN